MPIIDGKQLFKTTIRNYLQQNNRVTGKKNNRNYCTIIACIDGNETLLIAGKSLKTNNVCINKK